MRKDSRFIKHRKVGNRPNRRIIRGSLCTGSIIRSLILNRSFSLLDPSDRRQDLNLKIFDFIILFHLPIVQHSCYQTGPLSLVRKEFKMEGPESRIESSNIEPHRISNLFESFRYSIRRTIEHRTLYRISRYSIDRTNSMIEYPTMVR